MWPNESLQNQMILYVYRNDLYKKLQYRYTLNFKMIVPFKIFFSNITVGHLLIKISLFRYYLEKHEKKLSIQ